MRSATLIFTCLGLIWSSGPAFAEFQWTYRSASEDGENTTPNINEPGSGELFNPNTIGVSRGSFESGTTTNDPIFDSTAVGGSAGNPLNRRDFSGAETPGVERNYSSNVDAANFKNVTQGESDTGAKGYESLTETSESLPNTQTKGTGHIEFSTSGGSGYVAQDINNTAKQGAMFQGTDAASADIIQKFNY